MKRIEWYEETGWLQQALSSGGAFVVAKDANGKSNPMTIGWGQVGIVWSLPVFTVLVRQSRYTNECIRHSRAFTVCVPHPGELSEALVLCGTKSGRDLDKAAEAGLSFKEAQTIDTPIIEQCGLFYECEVVAQTQQARENFCAEPVLETYYKSPDYHLIVFGKILQAYTTT